MGVSTDGQLNYGLVFEEGFEFPWNNYELESWWREVSGYTNPHFYPFTDEGNYKPGVEKDDPRISTFFNHRSEWEKQNPVPVNVVNYCSDSCPMYILAIPGIGTTASRGYPEKIDHTTMVVTEQQRQSFLDFFAKYGIEYTGEPAWLLSSYWG